MGIPTFDVDMNIIAKLRDYPGSDDGLTPDAFRARFDLAGKLIQEYINTILLPNINMTTDVDALVEGVQKQLMAAFSVELGTYFEKVVQAGDYVLENGSRFNAAKLSDTLFRVYGGEAVMQGNLAALNIPEPVSIAVPAGTYGTNRNDLICLRFTRAVDGVEDLNIVHLQGETTQGVAVDPIYQRDNINVIAPVTRDLPLYRIRVESTTATLEPLFTSRGNMVDVDGIADTAAEKVIDKLSVWEGGSF